jgi:hypothetical protein
VNNAFYYYINHVIPNAELQRGTRITAGQRVGNSSTGGYGIDLGVLNMSVTLPFLAPARYSGDSLHADAPLRFYEEPLRSQLYSMVMRDGPDKDGKIDFDIAGRLQGNWFHETLPIAETAQPSGWSRHLAFVFDNIHPAEPRIAVGGFRFPRTGVFAIAAGDPPFESVSAASGLVAYHLSFGTGIGATISPPFATLLVQMLDASRLRVEMLEDPAAAAFTAAAQIYVR